MPAQSGDPITSALQRSISSVKRCNGETHNDSKGTNDDIDYLLMSSAKQVLLTEIKYEPAKPYLSSVISDLKSKYIVLSSSQPLLANGSKPLDTEKLSENIAPQTSSKEPEKKISNGVSLPAPKRVLYPAESVQLGWRNSVPVGAGFINLGNTCYLNSTLQALFHVPAFVNWLLNDTLHIKKCDEKLNSNGFSHNDCLICAMLKTLQMSHRMTGSAMKPMQIYSKLKSICKSLNHGHQEDAHEFLRYLLEGMERCYLSMFNGTKLDMYSKETTPLNQIFGGYLRTEVTCLVCHQISTTFQHFQDILLDIRQVNSVEDALDVYFSRENIGDGEQASYKCEKCHRTVAATKKFSIERSPKVLCVQLKRFSSMGGKNSKHVHLRQWLDLSRFRYRGSDKTSHSEGMRYKLVGLVTHVGPSASYGHYTAVGLSSMGSYYFFDDSVVKPLSINNALNSNAYILMYELETNSLKQRDSPISKLVVKTANGSTNGSEVKDSPRTISPEKKLLASKPVSPSFERKFIGPQLPPGMKKEVVVEVKPSQSQETTILPQPLPPPAPSNDSNNRASLVPYLSESSDGESDSSSSNSSPKKSTSPSKSPQASVFQSPIKRPVSPTPHETPSKICKLSPSPVKEEEKVKKRPSEPPPKPSSPQSIGNSSGKWSITRTSPDGSEKRSKSQPETKQADKSREKDLQTVDKLMEMSHRGYGTGSVNSWNGNRSEMDKEVKEERLEVKNSQSSYDEELDRGKVKKRKKSRSPYDDDDRYHSSSSSNGRHHGDSFRHRKWKRWHSEGGRQNFYRNYVHYRSRNYSSTSHYRQDHDRWH